jgi:hypothetical protein
MGNAVKFWVRRGVVLGLLAVVFVAVNWAMAITGLLLLGALYWYSCRRMTGVKCWWCGGSGAASHTGLLGWLFGNARGLCWRCHGAKILPRWGSRMMGRTDG